MEVTDVGTSMQVMDVSAMIVIYNFVIGVLIMLSSEKLGVYAGYVGGSHGAGLARLTRVSTFTFGACVSVLCGGIYLVFHVLRIMV